PPLPHLHSFPTRRSSDLALRIKIMKHQRVTVAEQEQWTIRIRLNFSAAGFFAYVSNLNFFRARLWRIGRQQLRQIPGDLDLLPLDRKSTRLNSSHVAISY